MKQRSGRGKKDCKQREIVVKKWHQVKEANNMPSDDWSLIVQKATIYDLMRIIEEAPGKTYTQEELKKLFDAYIRGAEQ